MQHCSPPSCLKVVISVNCVFLRKCSCVVVNASYRLPETGGVIEMNGGTGDETKDGEEEREEETRSSSLLCL